MAESASHWHRRRVLVTGAGGFIGSHLVERLLALGAEVRAYVHYNSRSDWGWLDRIDRPPEGKLELFPGELTDLTHVRNAAQDRQVVFHLGAQVSIPNSYVEPRLFLDTNVIGTFNVLTACREIGVERLVHTSSSEVYGSALGTPMSEEHPLQAQSPYAATKIGADKLVESYHRSFGLGAVTLRPFNTFGPRQSARAVIPTVISQALWADQISLGSLTPRRDWNFVSNTVDAFIAVGETEGIEGEVFNVGSGLDISVGEMAAVVVGLVGRNTPIHSDEARERPSNSEVSRLQADYSKATRLLGWHPAVSLADGLKTTIEWVRSNRDSFKVGSYAI